MTNRYLKELQKLKQVSNEMLLMIENPSNKIPKELKERGFDIIKRSENFFKAVSALSVIKGVPEYNSKRGRKSLKVTGKVNTLPDKQNSCNRLN